MDNDFKNIEWLEELAKRETTQEQKELDQAIENYEKHFGNRDMTTVFEDNIVELTRKINDCIKTNIEFDNLYLDDISNNDLI